VSEKRVRCFDCDKETTFVDKLSFRAECEACSADLHVCKNCDYYDPAAYNECREPSADPVKEKERANFCDYFIANADSKGGKNEKDEQLSAAEALFKK